MFQMELVGVTVRMEKTAFDFSLLLSTLQTWTFSDASWRLSLFQMTVTWKEGLNKWTEKGVTSSFDTCVLKGES